MLRRLFILSLITCVSFAKPALLPMPQSVEMGERTHRINAVSISAPSLKGFDAKQLRFTIKTLRTNLAASRIKLAKNASFKIKFKIGKVDTPRNNDEAYSLVVTSSSATITAPKVAGLFYGSQTLKQLIEPSRSGTVITPCKIVDYPAFKIRGFMHDVGRNFQSVELLKKQIDIMAMYKYSVFHWHFTEYFGWRLESKIFPQLQSEKAFGRDPGKYYTQKEFKEIVEYCRLRNITVIPEFDSPGHSDAFKKGMGFKTMREPEVIPTMVKLIDELCSLAPKEVMPYIHLGTDEVRAASDKVGSDYLPALNNAVRKNGREVIGWWHGMHVPGDDKQIQQTWAKFNPRNGNRHIDSRSNYINHLTAFDAPLRLFFQQPCRKPYGDDINLGGILCYWPDTNVDDENLSITNSPVILSMVGYSESVWTGIKQDKSKYWAKMPEAGSEDFKLFQDYERRIIGQRRFVKKLPFLYVKQTEMPWKLIGPFKSSDLSNADTPEKSIKDSYKVGGETFKWWDKTVMGAHMHIKHFFGFSSESSDSGQRFDAGKDVVYAYTNVYSPKNQKVGFWINFNTTSTSDQRGGCAIAGQWNKNKNCNIWVNGKELSPPNWKNPGKAGKEIALTDEVFTSRKPTVIALRKGWNKVLLKTSPTWKWCFTFAPVKMINGSSYEVKGLKFSTNPKK